MNDLDQDRRLAHITARGAARRSLPYDTCPWSAETSNRHRMMRFVWGRTYARHRPDLCDRALADGEFGVLVVAVYEPYAHGRDAAEDGEPITACPYPVDAVTAVGRAQFWAWFDGYTSVRPFPIDYSG